MRVCFIFLVQKLDMIYKPVLKLTYHISFIEENTKTKKTQSGNVKSEINGQTVLCLATYFLE